ncbi:AAA family ATPase, partial [Pseudomonas syringae pv. tomato]
MSDQTPAPSGSNDPLTETAVEATNTASTHTQQRQRASQLETRMQLAGAAQD